MFEQGTIITSSCWLAHDAGGPASSTEACLPECLQGSGGVGVPCGNLHYFLMPHGAAKGYASAPFDTAFQVLPFCRVAATTILAMQLL